MVADWMILGVVLLAMVFGPVLFFFPRLMRSLDLGSEYEKLERARPKPEWVPTELEVSTARLRAARARRREAEVSAWESEFHALGGGCPVCSARLHSH